MLQVGWLLLKGRENLQNLLKEILFNVKPAKVLTNKDKVLIQVRWETPKVEN